MLRYVFGYQGYARLLGEITTLKRTSPSAGGFHPVEAYPLVLRVEGVEPGLYHYNGRDHTLERIAALDPSDAGALPRSSWGQTYFADAHVLVALRPDSTAPFGNTGTIRRRSCRTPDGRGPLEPDALSRLHRDGARGLRDSGRQQRRHRGQLGLDGYRQGVLAVCGFGKPAKHPSPFDPTLSP